ncbi:MAG: response regulator [Acidobacteriota bacterium]
MPFSLRPLLIADHDEIAVEDLRSVLSREHFSVDVARDGDEALRFIKRNWYSAVLLDLLLPRLNGFEVLRELKALHPAILKKVIIVTGASPSTVACVGEFAVHGVLAKPLMRADLLPMIAQCTGADRTSRIAAASMATMPGKMQGPSVRSTTG